MSNSRTFSGDRPTNYGRWIQAGYVATDLLLVVGISLSVFFLRYVSSWRLLPPIAGARHGSQSPSLIHYAALVVIWAALIAVMCQEQDLYRTSRTRSALREALAVTRAVSFATILLIVVIYLDGARDASHLVIGVSAVLNLAALEAWRYCKRQIVIRRVARGTGVRNVLIVGADRSGLELARYLEANQHCGFAVKGFVDANSSADPRMLGTIEDFATVVQTRFIDEVFITIPRERAVVKEIVHIAQRLHLDVKVVPDLYDGLCQRAPVEYLGDIPVMSLHGESIPVLGLFVKRVMDIAISVFSLLLTSPVMVVIAIAIKLDSSGNIFYRAPRVGKRGREFNCYKFRTMVSNADGLKDKLRYLNERQGPIFKICKDPRITRIGRFLRRWSLDEIPQLVNVFRGEMSLVGPRPHPVDDFERYTLAHRRRLDVTPGVTGPWQISSRQDPSFETSMKLDVDYIENWGPWLDIKILAKTVSAVLRGGGA